MFPQSKHYNFYLHAKADDHVQNSFRKYGTADFALSDWIVNNVQPGWFIYDVGANIFEFTELAARAAGKHGRVFSFEPQHKLVDNYLEVRKHNRYDNVAPVQIYRCALGNKTEKATLKIEKGNAGCATISDDFNNYYNKDVIEQTIQVYRADSLNLPNIVPDLIKIDIEGAEPEFWEGTPEFIQQSPHIIIEVGPYTPIDFIDKITKDRVVTNLNDRPIEKQTNLLLTYK